MTIKCPSCEVGFEKLISLSIHYRSTHKKPAKDLYVALYHNNTAPTCKCGCGQETKFLDIGRGFNKFIRGHAARVNNNFQTEKSKTNSLNTRREMIKSGEWKPFHETATGEHWALGKTKETDPRIAKMSEAILINPEERARRSNLFKELRKTGAVKILYGPDHSQWKGGMTSLAITCRANRRLYTEWKIPRLKLARFQCEQCLGKKNLEVHHNMESFSEIMGRIAKELGWNDGSAIAQTEASLALKTKISEAIADYHIQNNVSGIVLCEDCHNKAHGV